jgi:hypothetical protein
MTDQPQELGAEELGAFGTSGATLNRRRDAVRRLEQNRRRGELQRAVESLPRGTGRLC